MTPLYFTPIKVLLKTLAHFKSTSSMTDKLRRARHIDLATMRDLRLNYCVTMTLEKDARKPHFAEIIWRITTRGREILNDYKGYEVQK